MNIAEIRGEVYFLCQQKIYKFQNGSLCLWKDFSATEYFGWMVGRSEIDFFAQGKGNNIVHYNGSDIAILFYNTADISFPFLVGDSVFFACVDYNTGITTIIHGKLK